MHTASRCFGFSLKCEHIAWSWLFPFILSTISWTHACMHAVILGTERGKRKPLSWKYWHFSNSIKHCFLLLALRAVVLYSWNVAAVALRYSCRRRPYIFLVALKIGNFCFLLLLLLLTYIHLLLQKSQGKIGSAILEYKLGKLNLSKRASISSWLLLSDDIMHACMAMVLCTYTHRLVVVWCKIP